MIKMKEEGYDDYWGVKQKRERLTVDDLKKDIDMGWFDKPYSLARNPTIEIDKDGCATFDSDVGFVIGDNGERYSGYVLKMGKGCSGDFKRKKPKKIRFENMDNLKVGVNSYGNVHIEIPEDTECTETDNEMVCRRTEKSIGKIQKWNYKL
jgi:hypothetical protein